MTASPYHLGINELANDAQLHDMTQALTQKTPHMIDLSTRNHKLPNYDKTAGQPAIRTWS